VEKDCRACGLNREDAMDRARWRKELGMIDDHDEHEWVNVSSGTGSPGFFPEKFHRAVKRLCVCVLLACLCSPPYHFSRNPIKSFFQIHKAKIELLSLSSKLPLHLSYNKNGISMALRPSLRPHHRVGRPRQDRP